MLVKTTDGTPDAVKVARPVWSGGKSGDNFKGLPITMDWCDSFADGKKSAHEQRFSVVRRTGSLIGGMTG